jgi:feruloyl-CoA synthase
VRALGEAMTEPQRPALHHVIRDDGSHLIWADGELPPHPVAITDRLLHWSEAVPERVWMAERQGDGWRRVSYGQAAVAVQAIGGALLSLGLSVDRPLLIVAGNSLAHALAALGAQHVGIPSAAIAPAYAGHGGEKLGQVAAQLSPGAIFADDPANPAFAAHLPRVPVLSVRDIDAMAARPIGPEVAAAHAAVTAATVAKFLFTSGTTGKPKAVIQTHGMLSSNQAIVRESYDFLKHEPPVLLDWAPWNHTASGNKVFNMAIWNGGTYHIDHGRPTPDGIADTLRNLGEVAPTWYFNVPIGYQFILDRLEADAVLAGHFFSRLRMLMYAGAGMSQPVWDRLAALSARHVPGGVPVVSALGATETGPFALYHTDAKPAPGNIGIPAVGVVLKLVPTEGKLEARLKSPSVTPGYWRDPELTAQAFDEEGFYRLGDALRFAVPGDPAQGFLFDGRLAENFKLASGTWVSVQEVRAALVAAMEGIIADAVIAGPEHDDLRALLLPNRAKLEQALGRAVADPNADPDAMALVDERLDRMRALRGGSATRVVRARFLASPLRFEKGEVTDKGSINQRAVLRERPDEVAALYGEA